MLLIIYAGNYVFLNNMWKTQYLRNIVIDKPLSTMYATNNSAN